MIPIAIPTAGNKNALYKIDKDPQTAKNIPTHRSGKCLFIQYPLMEYPASRKLQQKLVALRKNKNIPDSLVLLEHPSVFTLGNRGDRKNLKASEAFLKAAGIPVVHVERGGDITYHGPGQLVGYPIWDLQQARMKVVEYINCLEEVMIRVAADWGVSAKRNPLNRGTWVGHRKIGSVGIAVRRGISFHGFAFNVNLSLKPFEWINPCGLEGIRVTSLSKEMSGKISMAEVRQAIRHQMEAVFEIQFDEIDSLSI